MHFAKLSTVSVNEWKKCLVKSGKDNVYIVHFRFTLSAREKMTNLIFRNGLFDYLCSNCDMTLHLILKTCWYNMITQEIKREEYRENKPYWNKQLFSHKYTHVCFHRAYTNETMTYKIESISIGRGRAEWGAPSEDVYIIKFSEEV